MKIFKRWAIVSCLLLTSCGGGGESSSNENRNGDGGGNKDSVPPTKEDPVSYLKKIDISAVPGGLNGDIAGVGGAHAQGIKGSGVAIAICETEYNKTFLDSLGVHWEAHKLNDTDPPFEIGVGAAHCTGVVQRANAVSPKSDFVICHQSPAARDSMVTSQKATVLNLSAGMADDKDIDLYQDNRDRSHQDIACEDVIFGNDEIIVFIAAGNKSGYASCNRIRNDAKKTTYKLSDFDGEGKRNVFYVGTVRQKSHGEWELDGSNYPAEGSKDTHFFVCINHGGTSYAAPECAAEAALIQSCWPYFKTHCNQLGILLYETAEELRVTWIKTHDTKGTSIAPSITVTENLRRIDLKNVFSFDDKIASLLGRPFVSTTAQACAAFGSAFCCPCLSRAISVDKYGRSWSGVTNKEANLTHQVMVCQDHPFASVLEWFAPLSSQEGAHCAFGHVGHLQVFGRCRNKHFSQPLEKVPTMTNGILRIMLLPGVCTTVVMRQSPGAFEFRSSGVLSTHEHCSQQNGLLALLPMGTVIHNSFPLGSHIISAEFFKGTEKSEIYANNKTQGGLLGFAGHLNNVAYRLRAGFFCESDGVLTTRTAGAFTLGPGSVTSITDLTAFWEVSQQVCFVSTFVYGCTRVRTQSEQSLLTPTAPLHTLEWRAGMIVKGAINYGIFYTEPRRVVSAPMWLKMPVEHCANGSIRYEERALNLRPNACERRVEAVMETPLFPSFLFSVAIGYIHNRSHCANSKPHMTAAFSIKRQG
ncbi:MAG: hypothetical protein LBD15_04645 [Holosporales bacterium]|nr:hypothetical protein [Holosporales bacterium]